MDSTKRIWLVRILALVGLGLSIELANVYYHANFDKTALFSFCSINDYVDCDGVARTRYSQFAGIPLAWWGIFLYLFIMFLSITNKINWKGIFAPLKVFKNPLKYISALGVISFTISMVLAGISLFKIEKICILCIATYFLDLIISIASTDFSKGGYIDSFKTSFKDFIDGVKQYKVLFTVVLLIVAGFLAYTNISYVFTPHLKFSRAMDKYRNYKRNPYRIVGNQLGDPNGKVEVIMISDFVCPMCKLNNIIIHQAVKEYENIHVKHYNFPLDKDCNQGLDYQMHSGACLLSKIAIAAKKQNHYWDIASELYYAQTLKTNDILKMAKDFGLDEKRFWYDIISKDTEQKLLDDIAHCNKIGVDATPMTFINGEKVVGLQTYKHMTEIMEKHGAVKRKK